MKIQEYKILAHIVRENVQYFQMLMHSSFGGKLLKQVT